MRNNEREIERAWKREKSLKKPSKKQKKKHTCQKKTIALKQSKAKRRVYTLAPGRLLYLSLSFLHPALGKGQHRSFHLSFSLTYSFGDVQGPTEIYKSRRRPFRTYVQGGTGGFRNPRNVQNEIKERTGL